MTIRLWFKLFVTHFLVLVLTIVGVLAILINGLHLMEWQFLMKEVLFGYKLWSIILSYIFVVAASSSFVIAIGLSEPYESVHARINWLLLGKYQHPSFELEKRTPNWYESHHIIDQEFIALRDKIAQLSFDLQEFTAAPIFVGKETKEEIIEQERQRIARELHDSVSQQLFASMMMLSAINQTSAQTMNETGQKQLKKIEEIINNAQTEMRALLLHLRPIELADKTLKQGITQLLSELQPKIPQQVYWELADIPIESGIEDHLFRIVQEAISNTLRHAKASKFEIYLTENDNAIQMKIIDNGKGFDVEHSHKIGSYGLINMKERITALGGTIKINSLINQGTSIDIKIPVNSKVGAV